MKFDVYFEIYNKKLVVRDIEANSQEEVKKIVRDDIKFHKVEEVYPYEEPSLGKSIDDLMNMFGMKKKI